MHHANRAYQHPQAACQAQPRRSSATGLSHPSLAEQIMKDSSGVTSGGCEEGSRGPPLVSPSPISPARCSAPRQLQRSKQCPTSSLASACTTRQVLQHACLVSRPGSKPARPPGVDQAPPTLGRTQSATWVVARFRHAAPARHMENAMHPARCCAALWPHTAPTSGTVTPTPGAVSLHPPGQSCTHGTAPHAPSSCSTRNPTLLTTEAASDPVDASSTTSGL